MLLKLENIGKIYDSNDILTVGIRGIDLAFDYNEFVTIEGESGSGKSTLLNVIGANDTYEEGELYFNGEPTSHYSEADWEKYREKNIATIFQDFNIIENLTVLENVELALLRLDDVKERKKRAKELIARVGLTEQMNRRGSKLSGGEKQRTVIARALAKDAPIILADEPTGNLDVKASKEVAALLKEVSKDKLVIVVTHNPEFFKQYATRRVRIYDGSVSEDKMVEKPVPLSAEGKMEEVAVGRFHNFRNTLYIGILNYKSRPKFTAMMSLALFVCAITLFIVFSVFSQSLIQPLRVTLDDIGIDGKLIISKAGDSISQDDLDELQDVTGAGYSLVDSSYSQFEVSVPRSIGMLSEYTVTCIYDPYSYALEEGEAVLVLPVSAASDEDVIKNTFLQADAGIDSVSVKKTLTSNEVYLYLSYDMIMNYGIKIQAINSSMMMDSDSTTIYTFRRTEALEEGQINLINSNYYDAENKTIVFSVRSNKSYTVVDDTFRDGSVSGMIAEINAADYDEIFGRGIESGEQSCLYFSSDSVAEAALSQIPDGYEGLLSDSRTYVQDAGEVFAMDVLYYIALIVISLCLAMIISIIFMRSVKIFQSDFAVYRTLGIPNKVSSRSLYIQMLLVFLPTLVLLPLVSLIAAVIPSSTMAFISVGSYFFIEILLLIIVEFVAFGFNKSLSGQSIRKSLRRGSK